MGKRNEAQWEYKADTQEDEEERESNRESNGVFVVCIWRERERAKEREKQKVMRWKYVSDSVLL